VSTPLLAPVMVPVCPVDELPPGRRLLIEADRLQIVITNVDGRLYAFRNVCPHQGAPLMCGPITGTMVASVPHQYEYGCDNEIVRCPLHGWEFHMATGKSVAQRDTVSIKTYPVETNAEHILIQLPRQPESFAVHTAR
jgi:nitrite reductase/ring-hydroxylating ferredoxin subunit